MKWRWFWFLLLTASAWGRELSSAYMVPAAANKAGLFGTHWHTDLTLVNPHNYALPLVLQFLPSGRDNSAGVPTVTFALDPYETLNLWDVLGPHGFDARGWTGALYVSADTESISCPPRSTACDFAVFSRTYTVGPLPGEFGQALPGFPAAWGLDWQVLAYLPQLFVDQDFRTNLGVASLSDRWVEVGVDLQAPNGALLSRARTWIPPFGHVQWGLSTPMTGATAVVYLTSGPEDALVFPYASVVSQGTGDPVYVEAHLTPVGVSAQGLGGRAQALGAGNRRPPALPVASFSLESLKQRPRSVGQE